MFNFNKKGGGTKRTPPTFKKGFAMTYRDKDGKLVTSRQIDEDKKKGEKTDKKKGK